MPVYEFKCASCDHECEHVFSMASYPDHVENSLLKDVKCEKCGQIALFRHITKAPEIGGGGNGYMSMEKYWEKNPGLVRKNEDKLAQKVEERHRKRIMDRIDKQRKLSGKENRHKGYGPGNGENKTSNE